MTKKGRSQRIDTIFVLLIFCIFAVSVLMVLMLSASTYKNITDISRDGHDERAALSYIRTKAKNNDVSGGILIDSFCGLPALCFDEEFDFTPYRTMIYYYNGWVYELFSEKGLDFLPEDGSRIIRIGDLAFEETGYGLIRVESGGYQLLISPRSGITEALPGAYPEEPEDGTYEGGATG